jgi:hypothetical protein
VALLLASSTWIAGCVEKAAPLAAPPGWVAIASLAPAPGVSVIEDDDTGVRPVDVKPRE